MTLLAFLGGRHPKKFFHRNTTPFGFEFGENAVRQPLKVGRDLLL
jgi:hypothetical protein